MRDDALRWRTYPWANAVGGIFASYGSEMARWLTTTRAARLAARVVLDRLLAEPDVAEAKLALAIFAGIHALNRHAAKKIRKRVAELGDTSTPTS